MKKLFTTCIMLGMVLLVFAAQNLPVQADQSGSTPNRIDVLAYNETFETGATGWTHYDGAVSPNNWHIYNSGSTQGNCWWMGDPALASGSFFGGYYSHQYLVLDTPSRTLSAANATLTFKLRYYVEDPAGAEAPYTGWDACNVRISTNGGNTWTPISGTPAYNITSAYSFGFEHNEGPNIPGWGGILLNWTTATFSLSSYVGQNVKIRFAFASDPAYDTSDDAAMFGMMVDDIAFGGYSNNGVNDGQMTWSSLVPLGGDLWNIATDAAAPSPTHVMRNQNNSGSYNPNMLNYLVSPSITLPTTGTIRADFMIKGLFTDPDTFPNVDYWGWEISPDNGTTWNAMSNPYADPDGNNYVYSDVPSEWTSVLVGYSTALTGDITDFCGQTVKFRWYFQSDTDTPSGTGIMIDDFKIFNDVAVSPPENLVAVVMGSNVMLNWEAPGNGGGQPGWLNYDGDQNDSIGTGSTADFDVAARWAATGSTNSILPYVGMNITKIKFYPNEASCSYAIRLWTGTSHTQVYDQAVSNPTIGAWNEIILSTPFTIPAGTEIMAGYRCNATTGYPAGCDAGPQVEGFGNMIRYNNAWTTLTELSTGLTYNWNIRVYVEDARGQVHVLGESPQNAQFASGTLAASGRTKDNPTREVSEYKIYRDGTQVGQVAGTVLTFTDTNVPGGMHGYTVTAMYGTTESPASNVANAFVLQPQNVELNHDDGSAEQGYTVGPTKQMAVKYAYSGPVSVKWAKIFVHTPGTASIIVRLFDDDGANGMPGTQIAHYTYAANLVTQGWNIITLPTEIAVADGSFYLAILETVNAAQIGLDTSSHGYSYKKVSTAWEPVTQGEIMMRAIVEANVTDPFGAPVVLSSSMTVMAGVTINGQQAAAGDVLAAYVPVGGVPQLRGKQAIQVIDGIAGCMIQVFTESNGEPISFKVWDISTNTVLNCANTLPSEVNGTVGSWPGNLYPINATAALTQSIALLSGWNFISLNVSPADHSIANLISSIAGQVLQIKSVEGVYIPNNPYSTLLNFTDGRAYSIKMAAAATWNVQGMAIPATTPIPLGDGWNMTAFLPQSPLPVATAIASVASWLQEVKGIDGVYLPDSPYSTLTTMDPGKGYWIKVNGAHDLVYPSTRDYVLGKHIGLPLQHAITPVVLSLSMTVLVKCPMAQAGDIVEARVDDQIRGSEILIAPEGFPAALMQIYTEQAGEEIRFRIHQRNGNVIDLSTIVISEPQHLLGVYPDFVVLEAGPLANEDPNLTPIQLMSCYPNPCAGNLYLDFQIGKDDTPVSIEIYNIKGQKVRKLISGSMPKGTHQLMWDTRDDSNRQVATGIYFLEVNSLNYHKTQKMLLVK